MAIKRLFDLFFAVVLIIIFCIPMIIIAIIIFFSIGSPILFKQIRPGYLGKPFVIIKFRTMNDKQNCDGKPLTDDVRLTKLGKVLRKSSLDELPQLFNIIKGDMSFVGPRPLLMEYLPLYNKEQMKRHDVKPGVTGWTQINGRNAISWEQKFELDLWYVDNRSFVLDMKILCLTIKKVLNREGINADGYTTMPKFRGTER